MSLWGLLSNLHQKAGLRVDEVSITSAQLLALFATPITIVPAPGADKALVLDNITLIKPAGTAYGGIAAGEDLAVKYTNAAGAVQASIETTGFLDQATKQIRHARHYAAASGINDIVPVVNAALVLHLLTAEITTGNTPLIVRTTYYLIG